MNESNIPNKVKIYDFSVSDTYENLSDKIEKLNIEFISLDVFDTVLVRKDDDELKRFELVSKKMGQALSIDSEIIFNARKFAHRSAYAIKKAGFIEPSIDIIFELMCRDLGANPKNVQKLINIEIEFEKESLFLNQELWETIKKTGKKFFFVSDMYLRAKHINSLLAHFGMNVSSENIFASSDYNCSKRHIELFKIVGKIYDPKKTIHIGDNYQSDILNAKSQGFNTFFVRHTNVK